MLLICSDIRHYLLCLMSMSPSTQTRQQLKEKEDESYVCLTNQSVSIYTRYLTPNMTLTVSVAAQSLFLLKVLSICPFVSQTKHTAVYIKMPVYTSADQWPIFICLPPADFDINCQLSLLHCWSPHADYFCCCTFPHLPDLFSI